MANTPFQWFGNTGQQITTPEQAQRKRAIAEALIGQSATPGKNWAEGLADVAAALSGTVLEGRVAEAETAGRERAGGLFADLAVNSDPNSIIAALTSPDSAWASPAQTSIASALLSSGLDRADPMYQMNLEKAQLELDRLRNPIPEGTNSITNYEYLVNNGVDPNAAQGMAFGGNGTTINNMGNIPAGYEVVQDPNTGATRMQPIPGSPAALEAEQAAAAAELRGGQQDTATNIITSAAQKARDALQSGAVTTGLAGNVFAADPSSQASELRRQLDVLKSNATVQNLSAMRAASPTGGALGSVTDKEGAMLAAMSGALDPSSPNFEQALDDYERVLLEVVHGPEMGRQVYESTRPPPREGQVVRSDDGEYRFLGGDPANPASWQKVR